MLNRLPPRVWDLILLQLPNRDKKSLRLTCKALHDTTHLRIDRVFLSPNQLNIDVFCALANHSGYRHQVTEIIWDDACFEQDYAQYAARGKGSREHERQASSDWFQLQSKCSVNEMRCRLLADAEEGGYDVHQRERQYQGAMPYAECLEIYLQFQREQESIIASGKDLEAFERCVWRFPSLKRVTISSAAHGWLFQPFYQTPMIRSFPYGFRYPITRSKTGRNIKRPWRELPTSYKSIWRAFCGIASILAANKDHRVTELVFETNGLREGGICVDFFYKPNPVYQDFVSVIKAPGFRRLDLSVTVQGQGVDWTTFKQGFLPDALKEAKGLEHFTFTTELNHLKGGESHNLGDFVPLRRFLPVDHWQLLQHFGLSQFWVQQYDLISLLGQMSKTLRSVHLSCLRFVKGGGGHAGLVNDMRDKLSWHSRKQNERVQAVISFPVNFLAPSGRVVKIQEGIWNFLYNDGRNPFVGDELTDVAYTEGVETDAFDDTYDRPYRDFDWSFCGQRHGEGLLYPSMFLEDDTGEDPDPDDF